MDRNVQLLTQKAKQGDSQSVLSLAEAYMIGLNVEVDEQKGVELLTGLTNQTQQIGDDGNWFQNKKLAMQKLADWHRYDCEPTDIKQAIMWYQKLAGLGDASAFNQLGWIFYNGEGVAKDEQKAITFFEQAIKFGCIDGYFGLGWCYYFDDDKVKTFNLWKQGGELGQADCFNNLGVEYESGIRVQKDMREAVKWYKKGAEAQRPKACFNLAKCYHYGKHCKKDLNQAVYLYLDALRFCSNEKYDVLAEIMQVARLKNLFANLTLADIYAYGRFGLEQNYEQAFSYLEVAKEILQEKKQNDIADQF